MKSEIQQNMQKDLFLFLHQDQAAFPLQPVVCWFTLPSAELTKIPLTRRLAAIHLEFTAVKRLMVIGVNMRIGGMNMRIGGMNLRIGGMKVRIGGMKVRIGGMNMRIGGTRMHLGITMIPGTMDHGVMKWVMILLWIIWNKMMSTRAVLVANGCGMRMPWSLSFQGPVCGLRLLTQGYGLRFLCQWFLRRSGCSLNHLITHHRNIF